MAEKVLRTISILDPAIDWVATPSENVKRFVNEDRENLELLTLRPNERAAIYTLRVIPHDVATGFIADQVSEPARYLAAFRAALLKVENGYDADGKQLIASWKPVAAQDAKRPLARVASLLSDDELAMFDGPTAQEIGAVAWGRYAFFHRGTVLSWPLPLSVQQTWAMVRARSPVALAESTATDGTPRTEPAQTPADPSTQPASAGGE